MSLRTRIFVALTVLFLSLSVGALALLLPAMKRDLETQVDRARLDLRFVGKNLHGPLLDLVYGGLWPAAKRRLETLPSETPRVTLAALYDAQGTLQSTAPAALAVDGTPPATLPPEVLRMFDQTHKPVRRETVGKLGWVVEYWQPLVHGERVQGSLLLVHSLADEEARQRTILWGMAALLGLLLIMLFVVAGTFLRRVVVNRLMRLSELMSHTGKGSLEARFEDPADYHDEIRSIGESFNGMVKGLQEREHIRATFGRYVSEDVAKRILASNEGAALGGEERIVTVLFSDIRGYSTISEPLAPKDVVGMLNVYLAAMQDLIDAHGGCVIEFFGDGILCVFGAPEAVDGHAEKAVRCALDMRTRLAELNKVWEASGLAKLWQEQGLATLNCRIGIHTGRVVAGNMGSKSRVKYAVVGDAVNTAARLEALNKETETDLLVSIQTLGLLPEDLRNRAIPKGSHGVKGKSRLVEVFTF